MDATTNLRMALHPKLLELIIFPTEKCNFRCTYCYETFEIGKMRRGTIDGIKNLISARIAKDSLDHLALSWFGGEPTLAFDVMTEVADYAKSLLDDGSLKSLSGNTTTNAYRLTVDRLKRLVQANQRSFQVSLDGYGEGHDATRKYASGGGTFDVIWQNLLEAHRTDLDFRIMLRLHLTQANAASMERLVDAICDELSGDSRFAVFFKTVENLGGPNAPNIVKVDVDAAKERVRTMARKLRSSGFAVSAVLEGPESNIGEFDEEPEKPRESSNVAVQEGSATNTTNQPPPAPEIPGFDGYICYASKPNSLAIRADGSISKCTVLLEDPRNRVGVLNTDGTVKLDEEHMRLWMRGFDSFDPLELGCPAQNLPAFPREPTEHVISLDSLRRQKDAVATAG